MRDLETDTAQALAESVRDGMCLRDRALQSLGMQVTGIAPGRASVTMTVRDDMLNGFDTCHGGVITALADTAFAYACNSRNEMTVAAGLAVDFVAPARAGDVLTAQATETALSGRSGVYDVDVRNARGQCVALFRGRSHRIAGRQSVE